MEKALNITAVSGWAMPAEWFQALIEYSFPASKVKVLYPSLPGDVLEAGDLLGESEADLYIGYSLGSLWLMTHQDLLPEPSIKALLAPIPAFTRERNRGGKTPESKLKYLARQLKRNPEDRAPLLEFFSDCDIHVPEPFLDKIPEVGILLNGLEFLQSAPIPQTEGNKFLALVGRNDPLLDGMQLQSSLPQLEIVANAGHAPAALLKHLAEILRP